jgi:hydrogenase expression/formation protein HypE
LKIGKLSPALLEKLLAKIKIEDERVLLGPRIGEDAAAIRFGSKTLVVKTDPVTFATDLIGWYVVNVNANDIATMGAVPRWFLSTVLLPESFNQQEVEAIFDQIIAACASLGITPIGGHTETVFDLKRPIVVGCMLGETEQRSVISTSGAMVGDDIVLTKGIAIEGTAILAREAKQSLFSAGISDKVVARAAEYLFSPGISVLREAQIACSTVNVHSMHDPTEGGLATGLLEIAVAAKVGILVEEEKISLLPECRTICEGISLDPLGLLASGALLITLPASDTSKLLEELLEAGIKATVIGKVVEAKDGVKLQTATGTKDLPQFERDELAKFLDS